METPKQNQEGEGTELNSQVITELAPMSIIRTEATLSRFPIHTLDKKGKVNIRIVKKTTNGEVDVKWIVSHNSQAGRPGQLAYKIDTIIVNRRIDEAREDQKILPEMIRLGSLYEIAQELGLGRDTNSVRKALFQNSGANIDAKIRYTSTDGTEREVTFNDTRYGVLFTGEKISDGRKADAVYLSLHAFYREVLNNSPVRPLNYDYLKELPPSAQRFYEIVSRKMFAALKYGHQRAKLSYSEFCTYSAQQRQLDYDHFKKQMYKVHRPHIKSGYITKVEYEANTDEEGKCDWLMLYTPGPKAKAEFTFNGANRMPGTRRRKAAAVPSASREIPAGDSIPLLNPPETLEREVIDQALLSALTARGVFESAKLLASLPPDRLEAVSDYIDYWDSLVPREKYGAGLLHSLIQNNDPLPASFETRAQREARQAAAEKNRKLYMLKQGLETAYDEYKRHELDRYIAEEFPKEEYNRLFETCKTELAQQPGIWNRNLPPETKADVAHGAARREIAKQLTVLPYDEFCRRETPRLLAEYGLLQARPAGNRRYRKLPKIELPPGTGYTPLHRVQSSGRGFVHITAKLLTRGNFAPLRGCFGPLSQAAN